MPAPSHRETPLDERECWQLIRTVPVGRLAFTEHALPVILPAHFIIRDAEIVLASLADARVISADRGAIVAFEVDAYQPATQEGWCVSTLGRSRRITDTQEITALDELHFNPWTGDPNRHYIAIEVNRLRGKALTLAGGSG